MTMKLRVCAAVLSVLGSLQAIAQPGFVREPIKYTALEDTPSPAIGLRYVFTDPFDREEFCVVPVSLYSRDYRLGIVLYRDPKGAVQIGVNPILGIFPPSSVSLQVLIDDEVETHSLGRMNFEPGIGGGNLYTGVVEADTLRAWLRSDHVAIRVKTSARETDPVLLDDAAREACQTFLAWHEGDWSDDLTGVPSVERYREHQAEQQAEREQLRKLPPETLEDLINAATRIAILLDVSGSMAHQDRIDRAKTKVNAILAELDEDQAFSIVWFSDDAYPLGNRSEWTQADQTGRRWARRHLLNVEPLGATRLQPAIELVSRQRPAPDVLVMITDGQVIESESGVISAGLRAAAEPSDTESEIPFAVLTLSWIDDGGWAELAEEHGWIHEVIPERSE